MPPPAGFAAFVLLRGFFADVLGGVLAAVLAGADARAASGLSDFGL
ncbi:hypothetical protein GL4_2974 [Methyloceanibacter caenitepidi]|uniref:Uncharacterized protein n=1 Tax=Methyloceanibacter caenitepidi TaxID=1384459 RepID=A0A0A8K6N5_9HYPH|nr:hypothetical protein GL4_2974 [Methyloceanibacter caenitepidi]